MIVIITEVPQKASMRLTTLRNFGGELDNLWDSPRFDSHVRSRNAAHSCHKDYKVHYRPWQRAAVKSIKELTE